MTSPFRRKYDFQTLQVAAGSDGIQVAMVSTKESEVLAVEFTPLSAMTGDDTNTRTLSLVNKGANGVGTTVIALIAFTDGVDADAFVRIDVPLSEAGSDLAIHDGDVLAWVSTKGGTGIADPGGLVTLTSRFV